MAGENWEYPEARFRECSVSKGGEASGCYDGSAAIVADNVTNLFVDYLRINWTSSEITPAKWAHPERIENGSLRIHCIDYSKSRQTEFSVFWGNNLQGRRIEGTMVLPSNKALPKFDIRHSTIKVMK